MGKAFIEIAAGLKDATEHAKGKHSGVVEHSLGHIDVKAIREKTGMSQERFCATFGISLGTGIAVAQRRRASIPEGGLIWSSKIRRPSLTLSEKGSGCCWMFRA